jgi:hypothetical protein
MEQEEIQEMGGIYVRNNIGRRKRQEELKEGGGRRPGGRGF